MLLGAAGLLLAIAWIAFHRSRGSTIYSEDVPHPSPANPLPLLLRQRTVWGVMLGFGGINYTAWLYIAWLPGYLQGARHLSLARTGWVAALPFLCGAIGMISSGALADRFARARRRPRHRPPLAISSAA